MGIEGLGYYCRVWLYVQSSEPSVYGIEIVKSESHNRNFKEIVQARLNSCSAKSINALYLIWGFCDPKTRELELQVWNFEGAASMEFAFYCHLYMLWA